MNKNYQKEFTFKDGVGFKVGPDFAVSRYSVNPLYTDSQNMIAVKLESFQPKIKEELSEEITNQKNAILRSFFEESSTPNDSTIANNSHGLIAPIENKHKARFGSLKNYLKKKLSKLYSYVTGGDIFLLIVSAFHTFVGFGLFGSVVGGLIMGILVALMIFAFCLLTGNKRFGIVEYLKDRKSEKESVKDLNSTSTSESENSNAIPEEVEKLMNSANKTNSAEKAEKPETKVVHEDFVYNFKLHKKVMENMDKIPKTLWRKLYNHAYQIHQLREDLYKVKKLDENDSPQDFLEELKEKETTISEQLKEQLRKFDLTTRGFINIVEGAKINTKKKKQTELSSNEVLNVLVELEGRYETRENTEHLVETVDSIESNKNHSRLNS